ncbi:MAG: PASTA domain-containing protein, partial [Lachnospiraceae bacterium]|nr:PASTA domain-containing protein [Lachnospiraceae bacterium]
EAITIYVSVGKEKVTMPDIINHGQDAYQILEEAGLYLGEATTAPSDTVAAGNIISCTIDGNPVNAGDEVEKGSRVNIVVSTGPETEPPEANDKKVVISVSDSPFDGVEQTSGMIKLTLTRDGETKTIFESMCFDSEENPWTPISITETGKAGEAMVTMYVDNAEVASWPVTFE